MEAQLLKMSLGVALEYDPVGNIADLGAMGKHLKNAGE